MMNDLHNLDHQRLRREAERLRAEALGAFLSGLFRRPGAPRAR